MLAALVNEACERLLIDPLQPEEGWWGTWGDYRINLSQAQPYITAPYGVARLIVMDVCKRPVKIQNGFNEFMDFSRGLRPSGCPGAGGSPCGQLLQAYDREATYTLGVMSASPRVIRVFPSDSRDVGKTVIVQGTDANGLLVTSTDPVSGAPILGEVITLNLPFVDSTHTFAGPLSGLQKDGTFGPVTLFQVDPVSGNTESLSVLQAGEVSASYRRYYVNGLPANCCNVAGGLVQVDAKVKFDPIPVQSDPDYLSIPCIPALVAECEAIRFETMDTATAAAMAISKHQKALSFLFGQLDQMLGKERPALELKRFGSDRLRQQPV